MFDDQLLFSRFFLNSDFLAISLDLVYWIGSLMDTVLCYFLIFLQIAMLQIFNIYKAFGLPEVF